MSNRNPRSASISVDFGTSHTVASIRRSDGRVHQQLFDGSPQLPSAVFVNDEGGPVVGADAVHSGRRRPERYEPNPKRRIDDGQILLGDLELPVTSVIAAVLRRVVRECESTLGEGGLGRATVTVPAAWGPTRRHVVADAASAAGLGEVVLVPEPVAAASHFVGALGNPVPPGSGVVVYDLGGGTFDATALRSTASGFEVLAVDGADDLGGLDFDQALAEHLAASVRPDDERWRRLTAPQDPSDLRHRTSFLDEVRLAKERLSRTTATDLTIPLLDVDAHLTRDELETVAAPLLERTLRITQGVIRESGLAKDQVAGLFLVGAASRMPLVATMLHRELEIAPAAIEQPELAVSEGGLVTDTVTSSPPAAQPSPALPPYTPQPAPMPSPTAPVQAAPPMTAPSPLVAGPSPRQPDSSQSWLRSKRGMATVGAGALVLLLAVAALVAIPLLGGDDGDGDEDRMAADEGADASDVVDEPVEDESSAGEATSGSSGSGSGFVPLEQAFLGDRIAIAEKPHTGEVTAMAIVEADGVPVAVTGGEDMIVRAWELESGRIRSEYREQTEAVIDIAVTVHDGKATVISTGYSQEHVWYVDEGTREGQPSGNYIKSINWAGTYDGRPAYGNADGIWQLFTGERLASIYGPYGDWNVLAEIDGELRLVGVIQNRVYVADIDSGDEIGSTFDTQDQDVQAFDFGRLGGSDLAVTGTVDGTVKVWNLATAEQFGTTIAEDYQTIEHLELVDLGGTAAVLVGGPLGMDLFDLETGEQIGETIAAPEEDWAWTTMEVTDIDGHPVVAASTDQGDSAVFSLRRP